jgi:AcrR family transcriptional regulator
MAERITRSDVVQAALALLDEGGFPALAMRRIAAELGVQQSALYWHFESKQALLAAVADKILADVAPTMGRTWKGRVRSLAAQLRAALLFHQDGAELVATSLAFRLGGAETLAMLRRELAASGASPSAVDTAATVLVHFILGFVTDEQQRRQAAALGAIRTEPSATPATSATRFERGVDLIIVGLERQVSAIATRDEVTGPDPIRPA